MGLRGQRRRVAALGTLEEKEIEQKSASGLAYPSHDRASASSMTLRGRASSFAACALFAISMTTSAADPPAVDVTLFDDFNDGSGFFDPGKWNFSNYGTLDSIEAQSANAMLLLGTAYGGTSSDSDLYGGSFYNILLNQPSNNAVGLQADVDMITAIASHCAANTNKGSARVRITGEFFNDGSSSGPGDATGDMFSEFAIRKDSDNALYFNAYLFRCGDSQCDGAAGGYVDTLNLSTPPQLNRYYTLRMQWDPSHDQVVYTLDPGSAGEEQVTISYSGYSDSDPAAATYGLYAVGLRLFAENCTASRQGALAWGYVDNVGVLHPSLSPPPPP